MESLPSEPVREAVHPLLGTLLEIGRRGGFEGTATELLGRLEALDGTHVDPSVRWPRSPEWLARMIGWATAQLREQGVEVHRVRRGHKGERILVIAALDSGDANRQPTEGTGEGVGGETYQALQRQRKTRPIRGGQPCAISALTQHARSGPSPR